MAPYKNEKEMYPDVMDWLKGVLQSQNKRAEIRVWDSSATSLIQIIENNNLAEFYPDYQSFDIAVDVVGAIYRKDRPDLIFVECKHKPITLRDLGQLLGYCRVAKPAKALLISPEYISQSMHYLLKTYDRTEVLDYGDSQSILIARWDQSKRDIDISSIIPTGWRM
jgi:hypothetical protein